VTLERATAELETAIAAIDSPWRVAYDGGLDRAPQQYAPDESVTDARKRLEAARKAIRPFQRMLYAQKRFSVLLVFQALDAAGKDGAIREVFEDLDPVNVEVAAFKQPTKREVRHDFLWRTGLELPQRGDIAVFNRSYYEEVLTVRVHPEFLDGQYAGHAPDPETLWPARYRAIREHERHLAAANTLVLKFWLNVSPATQARRFLDRLDNPEKRWKFSMGDVGESGFRPDYDDAVMHMLNETSRPWAPWFCVPADDRWYLRWQIADIVRQAMSALPLAYPKAEALPDGEASRVRQLLQERLGED
jgi:PPK2 family polyphosphate:nucleotide phosphotransferase